MAKKETYCTFESASAWAQQQGIETAKQWLDFVRENKSRWPAHIPKAPMVVYKDFVARGGWRVFLQTQNRKVVRGPWRPIAEVSLWANVQGIRTAQEWKKRIQDPDFPKDIRKEINDHPEFDGWGAFLGTGRKQRRGPWRTYHEARTWVKEKGVRSSKEWRALTKTKDFPADIPFVPDKTYRDEFKSNGGWQGFLCFHPRNGSSRIERAIKQGLSSVFDFDNRATVRLRDGGGPIHVDMMDRSRKVIFEYDGHFWHQNKIEKDELKTRRLMEAGYTVIRLRESPLPMLDEIWNVRIDNDVKRYDQGMYWPVIEVTLRHLQALIMSGLLNGDDLASKIDTAIRGPLNDNDFADVATDGWAPFREVQAWARSAGIQDLKTWQARTQAPSFPSNIPTHPERIYRSVWQGWGTFFGTRRRRGIVWATYDEAKAWARRHGIKNPHEWNAAQHLLPPNIPVTLHFVYKTEWKARGGAQAFFAQEDQQNLYVIRLAKHGELPAMNDLGYDDTFVMPMAA